MPIWKKSGNLSSASRIRRARHFTVQRVSSPLPTHSWTLPNSILIESLVRSAISDTLPIFDWQVSLAYATTFLCILSLQYIFKLITCSELSFRGPNLGPHQILQNFWLTLVLLIDMSFSFVHLKNDPRHFTRETTKVFVPLMKFLLLHLASRNFLVLLKCSFLNFSFISAWWYLL